MSFPPLIKLDEEGLKLLYHARPGLYDRLEVEQAKEIKDEDVIFELSSLLEFTNEHCHHVISDLRELPPSHITFDHLWTLFSPSTVLHTTDMLQQVKLVRAESSRYVTRPNGSIVFCIFFDYLDSDGRQLGYVRSNHIQIESFQPSIPVQELAAYPLRQHPECETLRKTLILRGESILPLHGRHFKEYKGSALREREMRWLGDCNRILAFNVRLPLYHTFIYTPLMSMHLPYLGTYTLSI